MKALLIHEEAEAEVEEAIAYLESQRAGLGREYRIELGIVFDRIRRMPGTPAPIDDRGTRKVRFERFSYTVYYVELDDIVWIAAVAHQKRRPRYWEMRRP